MKIHSPLLLLAFAAGLAGCLPADDGDDGDDGAGDGEVIHTEDLGDGSHLTVVDARDETTWQHLDFESGAAVSEDSATWDLGFLRFNVATRVEVASLMNVDFDALTVAPADGYLTDAETDPADMETMPGYALDLWYDYDHATHVLTARTDVVYVVHSAEGNYFKVQMQDYYDDAGTAGYVSLRWAPIEAPV